MRGIVRGLLFAAVIASGGCATVTAPPGGVHAQRAEDVGFSSERLDRLTARIREGVDKGELPGAVLVIGRQGRIAYTRTFGTRDPEAGDWSGARPSNAIAARESPPSLRSARMSVFHALRRRWLPSVSSRYMPTCSRRASRLPLSCLSIGVVAPGLYRSHIRRAMAVLVTK